VGPKFPPGRGGYTNSGGLQERIWGFNSLFNLPYLFGGIYPGREGPQRDYLFAQGGEVSPPSLDETLCLGGNHSHEEIFVGGAPHPSEIGTCAAFLRRRFVPPVGVSLPPKGVWGENQFRGGIIYN